MSFFINTFLGVRIFIWLYFLLSFVLGIVVLIYWHREKIRRRYYEFRFPEKVLRVIIHYKGNQFREFYRLIPEDFMFTIENMNYEYQDSEVLKNNDWFLRVQKDGEYKVKVDGKEYDLEKEKIIQLRKSFKPEIHYYHNYSKPLHYDFEDKKLDFSSKDLFDFKENDLFKKLLTLSDEKNLMMFIIILGVANMIGTLFIIAKMMEWI